MDIILKPTAKCNFNCKFCSAAYCKIRHPADGKVPQVIKDFVTKSGAKNIIITGGEPLMVNPSYYYDLHESCGCSIFPTTNLKDFYLHPDKWKELFNEQWFQPSTSFNYGDTRMWDENTVFTEEMFLKVMDLYSKLVNKRLPSFIAVIDELNEHTVMDHVKLAKRLGTCTKLNRAFQVGRQAKGYPKHKMYQHYINIIESGYEDYELNCRERKEDKCPKCLMRGCQSQIRCIAEGDDGKLMVSTCDEQMSMDHFLPEEKWFIPYGFYPVDPDSYIKPECAYCELFQFCNSCDTNREETKLYPDHCEEMLKLLPKLRELGFLLEGKCI